MVEAIIPDHIKGFFECSICFEEFSKIRYPCTLHCGHTLCKNCVIQLLTRDIITCPLDKKKFKMNLISANLMLLNLINRVKNFYLNTPFTPQQKALILFTKPCRNFSSQGVCKYGDSCKYLHTVLKSSSESSDSYSDYMSDAMDMYNDFDEDYMDDFENSSDYSSSSNYDDMSNFSLHNNSDSSDYW
jgi:hypothetical protein